MANTASQQALSCSFCGKSQFEIEKLVAGPGVYICDECVDLCNQIISDERSRKGEQATHASPARKTRTPTPPTIKAWEALSDDDLLGEMVRAHAAHDNVDRAVALHVAALRDRGISWARIGDALGMARQSAWERFSGEE